MDDYKLFRRDRQGTRDCGKILYIKECYDCLELDHGDDRVDCLWVRSRGKADILKGVCNRLPKKTEEEDKIFYKKVLQLLILLMRRRAQ